MKNIRKLSALLLILLCFLGFIAARKVGAAKAAQSVKFINPEDMVQGDYYYFSDHGSGPDAIQFDHLAKGGIYIMSGVTSSQSLFIPSGLWGTVFDAGNISAAAPSDIAHLQRCVAAGTYVP